MLLGNDFSDTTPNPQTRKPKINRWCQIKCISFCTAKETIHNEKASNRMGEKIVNHVSDKELICKIYEELTQLNNNNNTK